MNSFSCVITGHRPTRFKFKYNEKDKRCQRIKKCLQEQLIRLYHQGVRCFWVGGAMGVDMWAAELLLRMKEQQAYQDVELCLALPFEGYNADWDDWHRKRMDFICRYAEKVLVLGEMPSSESYKKRNYYMVEQAGHKHDCVILNSEGKILAGVFTIPNNADGFDTLLQKIRSCTSSDDKIKVGLEATGHYSYNILGFLINQGLPTYVINPLHTNLYRKSMSLRKTKTDRVDAKTIATMLMSGVSYITDSNLYPLPGTVRI